MGIDEQPKKVCQAIVSNVERFLGELTDARCQFTKKKAENPFIWNYAPDMYETPALEHDITYWYQYLI